MAKLITVFWRDIPAHVIGRQGRTKHKQELPPQFAKAIDRAAMRAGRGSSDAYLADWRRDSRAIDGDVGQAVADEVARLVDQFPDEYLEQVVKAGGLVASAAERDKS